MRFSDLLAGAGLASIAGAAVTAKQSPFEAKCNAFKSKIKVANSHIHDVAYIPVGSNITKEYDASTCSDGDSSPTTFDFCRVTLNVTTSAKSQFFMEAWLPSNYSGRFLSTGNGGLGGCVKYDDMAYAAQYGFATVGTNNGHSGDTGKYFYHNTEVLEDFAYRALHTGVVIGKELTKQFYTEGFKKSYYLGCSTGGRQGWKSIEKFPDDFDGVVAGSPALNFINLINWGARFYPTIGNSSADTFITPTQWTAIHSEILRQCDSLDGAVDGIIEDTDLCQPIFETLVCNSTATANSTCLTAPQIKTVNTIFSPLYGANGSFLFPRMQPGSELTSVYYNGPFQYAEDWYRYVVYNNPEWDPASWTIEDATVANTQNPFQISTFQGDISPFKKSKGKVLHYHGLEDGIITSDTSKVWYKHVVDTMGVSPSDLDDFYRFFPISGMGHCTPGTGAAYIGQGQSTFVDNNPEDNVLLAMVRWVEEGIAPEFVRGSKLNGTTVEYRRKHCKYPKRNKYVGPGSYKDENAWECV